MSSVGPITAIQPAVAAASQAEVGTVRGQVALEMQRKSVNMQAEAAAQLIAAVIELRAAGAPPPLATDGPVGTQLNEIA